MQFRSDSSHSGRFGQGDPETTNRVVVLEWREDSEGCCCFHARNELPALTWQKEQRSPDFVGVAWCFDEEFELVNGAKHRSVYSDCYEVVVYAASMELHCAAVVAVKHLSRFGSVLVVDAVAVVGPVEHGVAVAVAGSFEDFAAAESMCSVA